MIRVMHKDWIVECGWGEEGQEVQEVQSRLQNQIYTWHWFCFRGCVIDSVVHTSRQR